MKKHIGFGTELTMLELIIAIGLFAVFVALDLQIFAETHRLEAQSKKLDHAVIVAESVAECFKAGEAADLYYDIDWLPTDNVSADYIVTVDISSEDEIESARISVTDKSGELFSLMANVPKEALP